MSEALAHVSKSASGPEGTSEVTYTVQRTDAGDGGSVVTRDATARSPRGAPAIAPFHVGGGRGFVEEHHPLSSTLHISGCVAGEVSEAVVDFGWSFGRLATTRACQQSRVGPYLASNGS